MLKICINWMTANYLMKLLLCRVCWQCLFGFCTRWRMFLMLGYILETFCVYSIIIKWVNFHVFENRCPYIKLLHFCSFVCSVRGPLFYYQVLHYSTCNGQVFMRRLISNSHRSWFYFFNCFCGFSAFLLKLPPLVLVWFHKNITVEDTTIIGCHSFQVS